MTSFIEKSSCGIINKKIACNIFQRRKSLNRHYAFVSPARYFVEVSRYRCPIRWAQGWWCSFQLCCYSGKTDKWPQINWPLEPHALEGASFTVSFPLCYPPRPRQRLDPWLESFLHVSQTLISFCTHGRVIVSEAVVSGSERNASEIKMKRC